MSRIPYIRKAKNIIRAIEREDDGNYDVIEITPNRANSTQIYQLAGTPDLLVANVSNFLATTQYLGERFGDWDFEYFDKQFVNCFPNSPSRPRAWGDVANPWGKPIRQQPKFVEINDPLKDGYKLVAFWPDKSNDDEVYPLMGSVNDIANQAMHIMHFKWLSGELAHVLGEPVTEYIHNSPILDFHFIFYLSTLKKPPYKEGRNSNQSRRHQFVIHYPNLENFTYPKLREILGGNSGLTWGQWRAVAWLTDDLEKFKKGKGAPQIWASGSSEEVAKKNLDQLLKLTTAKVLRINCSHTHSSTAYPAGSAEEQRWRSYKIYPKWFVAIAPKLVAAGAAGQQRSLIGKLNTKRNKFTLFNAQEPQGWSAALRDFLRFR